MKDIEVNVTTPGVHPSFGSSHFRHDEQQIISKLSKEFFLTNGGETITLGAGSKYKYLLLKPTQVYRDMFNLDREVVVMFSTYADVHARTLDAFEYVYKKHSSLRLDRSCGVLISNDENVESSLADLIKNEPESQTIIPFYYGEFDRIDDQYFYRNRYRKYFYSRDLFACEAPLKKDIFFFGRSDLIQVVVNRFKSGENSGLFGLRKTGKTSLIHGIERSLKREGSLSIMLDCQDTSFNQRRWNEALYYLCLKSKELLVVDVNLPPEEEFTEKNASMLTESFFKEIHKKKKQKIFIIFDEIENISFATSPSRHWSEGGDFILFWQSMRSIFQRSPGIFSYLLVGTNPSCIEMPKIGATDNPIFNHFDPIYIPGFDVKSTREMVRKLGRRMGMNFDESVFTHLKEDFGGHPFLIRHLCSLISKEYDSFKRPIKIDRKSYSSEKKTFSRNYSNYIEMIINVLKTYYRDEYEMLRYLAVGEIETFNEFAELHPSYTCHLLGYGLITEGAHGYDFCIDAVKDYLVSQNQYVRLGLNDEEKWSEISSRRNHIEPKLRRNVRVLMKAFYGEADAKEKILTTFGAPRNQKLKLLSYDELFDPVKSEIYFSDLAKILSKNWDVFKNTLAKSRKETFSGLDFINHSRGDAHAKPISDEKFAYFRICISDIENDLKDLL